MNNQFRYLIILKSLLFAFQVISDPLVAQTPNHITDVHHSPTYTQTYYDLSGKLLAEENYDSAWVIITQVLDFQNHHVTEEEKAKILLRAGTIQSILSNYVKAISFTNNALEIAQKIGDKKIESKCLMAIGGLSKTFYNDPNNHENLRKVCGYYEQALANSKALNDTSTMIGCLSNLAATYGEIGESDKAWQLLEQIELLAPKSDERTVMMIKSEKGKILAFAKNDIQQGEKFLHEALEISLKHQLKTTSEHYLLNLSVLANAQGNYAEALRYLDKSGDVFPESPQKGYYDHYYRVYKNMGQYEKALSFLEQNIDQVKRVHNERNQETVMKWEAEMRTQLKEQQLGVQKGRLKNQKQRIFFFVLLIVLLTFLLIVSYYSYNNQRKLHHISNEQKAIIAAQAEDLRSLDHLKSRFFANVSHELRTPLTLILGPINTALKGGKLNNRNFALLTKAQHSGKNLLKLVGSILDLSKMESGKMELQETVTALFTFIHRIISAFESHAQREGIQFAFEYQAKKDLQLTLDKEKLEIILNNLLSNAIKFTPKDGQVMVTISDNQNNIEIAVKDTGRGIHPDDIENIFNRFYQSTQKNAPTEGGTGIGLALSREFVNLMGGDISVTSEWTKGSIFSVVLPRKEVLGMLEPEMIEKPVLETSILTTENITPNTAKQLLLVEDNHSLRDYLALILSPHYQVQTAENGQVALDILNKNQRLKNKPIDLIISDIMMPLMDGYQLLTVLKSKDYFRNIPVIMLTARADVQDKLKALRIGVDDYLLKPFDDDELLVRIENLLANYEERTAFLQTETSSENKKLNRLIITEEDHKWLKEVEILIVKEMSNSLFSNDYLAELLHISNQSLYRKIKKLTGLTPNKYIRIIRLQQAKALLENGKSVKKTAYEVGFSKVEYFSKLFKKEFGKSPSEYL